MTRETGITALFDLDGVLLNTEYLYTGFWTEIGNRYTDVKNLGLKVKGQTLKHILPVYFGSDPEFWKVISDALNSFETEMPYEAVPGAMEFLDALKVEGIKSAIVTSSNNAKMANVYRHFPELKDKVCRIFPSECFAHSKPDPECFIKSREELGGVPERTAVFEDSIHGLNAGRASGAMVVGLETTNPPEVVEGLSDHHIPDFTGMTPEILRQWIDER